MKNKKFMAIPIFLIIALVLMGFAYAHWEKIVTVNGKVNTGKVNLIIVPGTPSDTDNGIDPGKDKDVADTTIVIDPLDNQKAIITITNAYPCYEVYWHITIRNVGTIPVRLKDIIVDNPNACLDVQAWDKITEQLDPESWDGPQGNYQGDYSGYVHVLQCAKPGTTYTFTVEFVFWNWNEVAPKA